MAPLEPNCTFEEPRISEPCGSLVANWTEVPGPHSQAQRNMNPGPVPRVYDSCRHDILGEDSSREHQLQLAKPSSSSSQLSCIAIVSCFNQSCRLAIHLRLKLQGQPKGNHPVGGIKPHRKQTRCSPFHFSRWFCHLASWRL